MSGYSNTAPALRPTPVTVPSPPISTSGYVKTLASTALFPNINSPPMYVFLGVTCFTNFCLEFHLVPRLLLKSQCMYYSVEYFIIIYLFFLNSSPPAVQTKNFKEDYYWNEHFQLLLERPITNNEQGVLYESLLL